MSDQSNGVSKPVLMAIIREHTRLDENLKKAREARTAHRKRIQTYGIKLKNYDRVCEQIKAHDGGDEYREDLAEQKKMLQMLDHPLGHQFSLVDEFDAAEEETVSKHYSNGVLGFLAGMKEKDCPLNEPEADEWRKGFREAEKAAKGGDKTIKGEKNAKTKATPAKRTRARKTTNGEAQPSA